MKTRTQPLKSRAARASTATVLRHDEAITAPETSVLLKLPLSALRTSSRNVRRTAAEAGIEELAALIDAQGLLQPLVVTRHMPADSDVVHFEVEAGGRRLRALQWLRDHGRLAADAPIDCRVIELSRAQEVSLAENSGRQDMHPADQFEAFYALAQAGQSAEAIAQRFGVTVLTVQRRLRLAGVAPELLALYRAGGASLDQLQALAICTDPARQLAVWNSSPTWQRHPNALRARLTEGEVPLDDPRVQLIGRQAYEAAGGAFRSDLFSSEDSGFLTDVALLDQLVAQRLDAELETVRAEGWSWVELQRSDASPPASGRIRRQRELLPDLVPLDAEDAQRLDALRNELESVQAELEATGDDDDASPEQIDALERRYDELDRAIESLESQRRAWAPEQKAVAGARVLFAYGQIRISRGLLRDDEEQGIGSNPLVPGRSVRPEFSERLMRTLTSHRSAALQAALLDSTPIALCVLADRLAESVFGAGGESAVRIRLTTCREQLLRNVVGFEQTRAGRQIDEAREAWLKLLPVTSAERLPWLMVQPVETVLRLLALCVAMSVDVVQGNPPVASPSTDSMAAALELDMADWWSATACGFLSHVSMAQMQAAVTEACGASAALELVSLKKPQAALRAEQLLAGTRWLPSVLKTPRD